MRKPSEENKNNNFRKFLGILVIAVIVLLYIYNNEKLDKQRKKEDREYVKIENLRSEYKGKVLSKNRSKGYTGLTLIHLTNNGKLSISGSTRNYFYSKQNLGYFIQVGDSIFKPLGSDSVYIIRNNKKYYFILGKIIN